MLVYELQQFPVGILHARRGGDGVPFEASQRGGGGVARRRRCAPLGGATRGERDELDGDGVELRARFDQMRGGVSRLEGFPVANPGWASPFGVPRGLGRVSRILHRRRRRGSAGPVRVAHNLREPPGHLQGLQGLRDRRVPGQGEERSAAERPRGVGVGGREMLRAPQEHRKDRSDPPRLPQGGPRGSKARLHPRGEPLGVAPFRSSLLGARGCGRVRLTRPVERGRRRGHRAHVRRRRHQIAHDVKRVYDSLRVLRPRGASGDVHQHLHGGDVRRVAQHRRRRGRPRSGVKRRRPQHGQARRHAIVKVPVTRRYVEQREHHEVPVLRDERVHDQPRRFKKRGGYPRVVRRESQVAICRSLTQVHRPVPRPRRPVITRGRPPAATCARAETGGHAEVYPSVQMRPDVLSQRMTRVRRGLLLRGGGARRELSRVPQQVEQRPQPALRVKRIQHGGERE